MSSPPNALPMTAGLMDMEIPRTVMMRKIKQAADGKPVQKDAKTALSKAAAVFISYLTAAYVFYYCFDLLIHAGLVRETTVWLIETLEALLLPMSLVRWTRLDMEI